MTARLHHIVSFRLTNEEVFVWSQLKAATDENTWAAAQRLLMNDPVVQQRIETLLRSGAAAE